MTKWITIALGVLGLAMGIWTVATSKEELPNPPPAQPPSVNPYAHGIAASGLVEAATRNIAIAAPEAGLATEVFAEVNQTVKKGEPLFQLDPRPLQAELTRARAALEVAKADLARIASLPRPEDLPPLEAALAQARAQAADAEDQRERTDEAFRQGAATPGERSRRRFAAEAARAAAAAAEAELSRARAGASPQERAVAEARVAQAASDIEAAQLRLDRLTVRAPLDALVLRRSIEPGQFAPAAVNQAAMVIGDVSALHVRAQVDEEDATLLRRGAKAVVRLRGAVRAEYPLRMIRIEPWAQPKTQITGDSAERVDTRVVEVVFEIERPATEETPIFLGQVVDVFIDAPTRGEEAAGRKSAPAPSPSGRGLG